MSWAVEYWAGATFFVRETFPIMIICLMAYYAFIKFINFAFPTPKQEAKK